MVKDWCRVIKTDCGDLLVVKTHNGDNQPILVMSAILEDVGEVSHTVSYWNQKVRDTTFMSMDEGTALAVFRSIMLDANQLMRA